MRSKEGHMRTLQDAPRRRGGLRTRTSKCLLLCIVVMAAAIPALADQYTDASIVVNGTVTASTVTLTFDCTASSCNNWYLGDVTLKGFTFAGNPTLGTAPTGYTVQNGAQDNGAVGGGGGCNGTQGGQAVCWDAPSTLSTRLTLNQTVTFTAKITGGVPGSPLHFQATAYTNTAGSHQGGGKVWAASDDLTPTSTQPTPTPEPDTLILFGIGLCCLIGFLRHTRQRTSHLLA
jgi:hypothetical protein